MSDERQFDDVIVGAGSAGLVGAYYLMANAPRALAGAFPLLMGSSKRDKAKTSQPIPAVPLTPETPNGFVSGCGPQRQSLPKVQDPETH